MKVTLVTNIAPPYRIPLFAKLTEDTNFKFNFIFCTKYEGNRKWNVITDDLPTVYLSEHKKMTKDGYNYKHLNLNIIIELIKYWPRTVIITGLYPTMLFAFIFSIIFRRNIVYMTDGNIISESKLGWGHKTLRRIVFRFAKSFIGPGKKAIELFCSYGIKKERIFLSPLCIENNNYYNKAQFEERDFDLFFCGQLHARKMPLFFIDVVKKIMTRRKIKVVIAGDGPLKNALISELDKNCINYKYFGVIQPAELIPIYARVKILFFSTTLDAWGMVANEAMASGTPVITTPYAGCANDLVQNCVNGIVSEPDINIWSTKIIELLDDKYLWEKYSEKSIKEVKRFNYLNACEGIIGAVKHT